MSRLARIELDDRNLPPPTPEMDQERRIAIYDLVESNRFEVLSRADRPVPSGPYHLRLTTHDGRLVFDLTTEGGTAVGAFHLALGPLRQTIKDYSHICTVYFDAVRRATTSTIETIDMARRGIHDEGARLLMERLAGKVEIDTETARRLFTLICVLRATR